MYLYDTLSQKKLELQKSQKGKIRLFVCGPTVYDFSHLGHARTYVVFDSFVKYLRSQEYKIFYLQNITDIDDKIIARAKEQKIDPQKLAKIFEKEYLKDMQSLGVTAVNKYARATQHINEIHKQIENLIKKGYAYQTKNGVYFEVRKFNDYGRLSKQNLEEVRHGYRMEPDPEKKDPLDFSLWKVIHEPGIINQVSGKFKKKFQLINGEPLWKSPWGWGRPGWHIEDTAITEKYFGPQYEIHGGGNDLKFPHHEAEIAQQEAASGKKPLVKFWIHTGFLLVNGEKMSKSLHNFITIRDFLQKSSPDVLRLMIFSNHYRSPFDYSDALLRQSENSLNTINEFLGKLTFAVAIKNKRKNKLEQKKLNALIANFDKEFINSMDDDFNTAKALAATFAFISDMQKQIWMLSRTQAGSVRKALETKLKIFGISAKSDKIPAKISQMAKRREKSRVNKQFMQADELRKEIEMLGYLIEDTPFGPLVRKKS